MAVELTMENSVFDNDAHELRVAERFRQLARYDAFDQFVDLALDGVIEMDEAISAYVEDEKAQAIYQ